MIAIGWSEVAYQGAEVLVRCFCVLGRTKISTFAEWSSGGRLQPRSSRAFP